jgi:glycerol-3-phosphate acyltransferase PlsY
MDAAKGAVAVLIAKAWGGEDAAQLAALTSFLGHLFPVWLGFKGGKGVATYFGTLFALDWRLGLSCCAVWAVVAGVSRISSLAALVATSSTVIWALAFGHAQMLALILVLTLLVFVRHRANIQRLRMGTEPRIGRKGS